MFQLPFSPEVISKLLGVSFSAVILLWLAWLWIKDQFSTINKTIEKMKEDYQTCKYCEMQHVNLTKTLQSMDGKLDILIEKR